MKKRVAMFVTNPCVQDARVMKEATTLTHVGHEVRIFALANAHYPAGEFDQDGYTVVRLQFLNIFNRVQQAIWTTVAFITWPIRMLFLALKKCCKLSVASFTYASKGVKAMFGYVAKLLLLLPALVFSPLLALLFSRSANEDQAPTISYHHLLTLPSSKSNSVEALNARKTSNFLQRYILFSRKLRARLFIKLRTGLSFKSRRFFMKVFRLGYLVAMYAGRFVWVLYRLMIGKSYLVRVPLRQLKLLKSRIRRMFRLMYSKAYSLTVRYRRRAVNRVNRWVYSIFLPMHKISTYFFFCRLAAKHAIDWKADIAHAHDLNTMYAAKIVKDRLNAKVVYDSHELWIHRNRVGREAKFEQFIDRLVEKWLIKYADAVITVCDSIGDWLTNKYPISPAAVILRNMPSRMKDSARADQKSLGERLGLPTDNITMIYTGKITSGRGIEIGLQSLVGVDNLHFVLLGYGEPGYVTEIKELTKKLDVEDRVTFCEPVPHNEVTQFIYGADFALVYIEPVCLSYEYAMPNKLFESIQAGVPIMGSKLVEIQNLVESENIGMCFSSAEELSNNIRSGLSEEKLDSWRKSISEIQDRLCWDLESQKLTELYKRLAA